MPISWRRSATSTTFRVRSSHPRRVLTVTGRCVARTTASVIFTMRGMSCIDVAKELRAIRPGIPIALTSGRTSQETLELASSLGFDIWLSKPATVDDLCQTLDVLLAWEPA